MFNKKFLETDYTETSHRGYTATTLGTGFAGSISAKLNTSILTLGPKTEILYFTPSRIAKSKFRPPQRGGVIGNHETEPSGN